MVFSHSDPDALLTQRQLRSLVGDVSDMTIYRWRKAGILPEPIKIQGRNYFPRQESLMRIRQAGGDSK